MNTHHDQPPDANAQLPGEHDQPGESAPGTSFEVTWSLDTDRGSVGLSGELDFTATDRLYDVLDRLRRDGYRHLVLDLSQLRWLSASGAGVLAHAAHDYAQTGGTLLLSQPNRVVTRVLGLTDLHHLITAPSDTPTPPGSPRDLAFASGQPTARDEAHPVHDGHRHRHR